MSYYIERFDNHEIHSTMNQAEVLITEAESSDAETVDAQEKVSRLKEFHNYANHLLNNCDPEIVSINTLNNFNDKLSKLTSYLENYNDSGQDNLLNKANGQVDQMLVYLPQFNTPKSVSDLDGLQDSVTSFRRSISQHARYAEEEYEQFVSNIESLTQKAKSIRNDLDNQKQRLDNVVSNYQEQFSKAEDRRRKKAQEAAEERETAFKSNLEEYEQQLSEAEDKLDETVQECVESTQEDIDELQQNISNEANHLISDIERQKSEAEDIVGIISDTATTGRYQEIADREQIAMWVFQGVTVLSLGALVWFGYTVFSATTAALSGEDFSWPMFAAKVFATATIGVLAAYAARQADKHQSVLRRNRKMELELRAIGPYLNDLPEEDQKEVKKKLADRLFGNELEDTEDTDSFSGTPSEALKFMAESVLKLVNRQ